MNHLPDITATMDDDPGDDVQRRFRYQHGYGVILICSMLNERAEYGSIFFEHHEDIICVKPDRRIDYFQIKTRKPELGYWDMHDSALRSALRRFFEINKKAPTQSNTFSFVTNCEFLQANESNKDKLQVAKSPINLFRFVKGDSTAGPRVEYNKEITSLAKEFECEDETLLRETLAKTKLIYGPPLDGFDAVISMEHIAKLHILENQNLPIIHRIRDELIFKIYKASSLPIDPDSHTFDILSKAQINPKISAKRMCKDDILEEIVLLLSPQFHFSEGAATFSLGSASSKIGILEKKLARSGLQSQFEIMKRRSLSAESHLIQLSYKDNDGFSVKLDQIESIVLSVCKDIELWSINTEKKIDSLMMMRETTKALRKLSEGNPDKVYNSDYELLMGIAGLLTGDCKIWWTEVFDLEALDQ